MNWDEAHELYMRILRIMFKNRGDLSLAYGRSGKDSYAVRLEFFSEADWNGFAQTLAEKSES